MDKRIVASFFRMEPKNEAVPLFADALDACKALGVTPGERELPLSQDGTLVRLERLNRALGWIEGEVVRVQRDNIPHEAYPDGLRPSRAESQGHSAVFRYSPNLNILIIERNLVNMTPSRFLRYLRKADESARYTALPIPNVDLWERYGNIQPRRFSVTLASIDDPEDVEGDVGAIIQSGRVLHELTNGPTVSITVRAGADDGALEKGVVRRMIDGLLGSEDPGFEVTSLSVSGEDEDTDASDVLNFLDDVLREKSDIDLNGMTADQSYAARISFLRHSFAQHMDYLAQHYG